MNSAQSNEAPTELREIQDHISGTYFALRRGLAITAIAFPFFLYFWGRYAHGLDLQPSMSAYFFATTPDQCASFPMRTYFVGFLFAIGAGLFFYKGFTRAENWLLNVAGLSAGFVAVFPERINPLDEATNEKIGALFAMCPAIRDWAATQQMPLPFHYIAAVVLFVMLACVAWFSARKTLKYLPMEKQPVFRRAYKWIGVAMGLFPAVGYLVAVLFRDRSTVVFWVEAVGICVFGIYWFLKSRELSLSHLEQQPKVSA